MELEAEKENPNGKIHRGSHSAFTVFEPSGSGALGDPGGALSGIGLRDKSNVALLGALHKTPSQRMMSA